MSEQMDCPECSEQENITTIHDTLYICESCGVHYNPVYL